MVVDDIIWRLAQLASLPFQERYVVEGTAGEYVLAEELLENVDGIKFVVRRPAGAIRLSDGQRDALEDLFSYIEAHSGDALLVSSRGEVAALIRESETWKTLREMSTAALGSFGISADMTVEEIDQMSG
jgi:hypothetical protein